MKRVLIIDDELDILKIVGFRLIKMGYEVLTAADGEEGLKIVREKMPDLIIADLFMPKLSGDEVCRRVKADPATKHIPIIIMTASIVRGSQEESIHMIGAEDQILKPFEPEELFKKVRKFIG